MSKVHLHKGSFELARMEIYLEPGIGFVQVSIATTVMFHLISLHPSMYPDDVYTCTRIMTLNLMTKTCVCFSMVDDTCIWYFTHLPLGKMADTFADNIFLNENVWIPIEISLKFVPRGTNDNKSALVQGMAWRWTGDKPLPEQMVAQFTDAYMRH